MSKDEISVPRELLERVTEFTGGFHPMEPARSQLRALLAQPNTCTKHGGQCGLGGYCEPCHSVEPVAWSWQGSLDNLKGYCPDGIVVWPHKSPGTPVPLYLGPPVQAPVVLPSEDDQRAAFEAFFTEKAKTLPLPLGSVIRYAGGQYVSDYALFGWIVWGACLDELKRLNPEVIK